MTIFDRYVVGLFLKILMVCFCSLAGLYLIIDIFGNIDEFVNLGQKGGGLAKVLAGYYGPRLLSLFCEVAGLLYLLSAICTMTRLQNTSELAAVQSVGISVRRVAMPLVVVVGVFCTATLVAREVILPAYNEVLVQTAQDLLRASERNVTSQMDYNSLVTISGKGVSLSEKEISDVRLALPHDWPAEQSEIEANQALWRPGKSGLAPGFILRDVKTKGLHSGSVVSGQKVLLYGAADSDWLEEGEWFLPTGVPFSKLCFGSAWIQNASITEVSAASRSGSIRLPASQLIAVHWRMVRPLMDFCLILIGLPLVLRGNEMKLVTAAATCIGLVAVIQVLVGFFHFLGGQQILAPSALAAWAPALMLFPFGFLLFSRFNR